MTIEEPTEPKQPRPAEIVPGNCIIVRLPHEPTDPMSPVEILHDLILPPSCDRNSDVIFV